MTVSTGNGEETADSYGSRSESWLQNIQARRTLFLNHVFPLRCFLFWTTWFSLLYCVFPLKVTGDSCYVYMCFLFTTTFYHALPVLHHVPPVFCRAMCLLSCNMVFLYCVYSLRCILFCSRRCISCFSIVFFINLIKTLFTWLILSPAYSYVLSVFPFAKVPTVNEYHNFLFQVWSDSTTSLHSILFWPHKLIFLAKSHSKSQ